MKKFILLLTTTIISCSVFPQLSVAKMIGKYSKEYKIGFGAFYTISIPLNETGNQSVSLELFDIEYFPVKPSSYLTDGGGFASFKVGYRHIFSEESATGFFVEPQAGFCMTAVGPETGDYGKGLALALITGYSLEVGQRGNSFIFGLKYEADLGSMNKQIHSIGLRVAFNYSMFGGGRF